MTEIAFYHLTTTPLESALPKLLEKSSSAGFRAVVVVESDARVEALNQLLWTYDPASFLPHGSAADPFPEQQPIYITANAEAPNHPDLLVVTDNSELEISSKLKKVLDIFDGQDSDALDKARTRWKHYKALGHTVTYYKQTERGSWEKAA